MKITTVECRYPKCKHEAKHSFRLEIINEEGASAEMPFCKYHWYVISGGHFKVRKTRVEGKELEFSIEGPFEQVSITEQVMGAREMTKKEKE
jgi:hypothetical protein